MIIVTGAAGFIGSHILQQLNGKGIQNILAVDDLTDGHKYRNLANSKFSDYIDYQDFLALIQKNADFGEKIEAIFHQGACSDTTEWNGRYMMQNNYEYSKILFHYCIDRKIPFIYASSAAVYGKKIEFLENDWNQMPLNVYGYSKWQFDQYVFPYLSDVKSPVVGLRYFNVYGPNESHKGRMASVAFHFMNQLKEHGVVRLFEGSHGYENGDHERDFIYVGDVARVNLWFLERPQHRGIFNVGTGRARTFNDVARILIKLHGEGKIEYIPFPKDLMNAYQAFTRADLSALHAIGYDQEFVSLEEGLAEYFAIQR